MIEVQPEDGDAAPFVGQVQAVVNSVAAGHAPPEIFVIKIDNWFGMRWLNFSGKVLGALGVWSSNLTLPPFVPNRVRWECRFTAPDYANAVIDKPLHIVTRGPDAVQRRISEIAPSAAFLWFSGQSEPNSKAALMAYLPGAEGYWTWYAGWSYDEGWTPKQLKGISAGELGALCGKLT
ncbi:MAG: hypothetical protein AAF495_22885 [Pseudomonadota bacterium]